MEEKFDDTFLARWLADELTAEEKLRFENAAEYQDYLHIIESVDTMEAPSFDKKLVWNSIQEKQQAPIPKVRRLNTSWLYSAAAVILVIVGLSYVFLNASGETFTTGFGEQTTVMLPDGSEAILNAKTTLSYNSDTWETDRTLTLDGEAFFKVKKGEKFTVITQSGTVEVLGTQFNVLTNKNDILEVKCHEGKVKVTSSSKQNAILTQGMAFSSWKTNTSWNFNTSDATWRNGESNFKEMPLQQVMQALQNQYDIEFVAENIDTSQRFTGTFSHTNLKLALRTVFDPMEISHTFKGKKTVILKETK